MPTILAGSTDVTLVRIRALDSSGAPVDAAYNDAGIALWYRRGATGTKTAITPVSQTAGGAHTSGGFVAIDDGWCRLDLPDAVVAAGATDVIVGGSADNWELVTEPITLVPWDPQEARATQSSVDGLNDLDAAGVRAALGMAAADLDTQLDAILAASGGGAGANEFVYTLTDGVSGAPIAGADVWVTSGSSDPNTGIVASGVTDDNGQVTFWLDAGTWYLWRARSGYNFTNPDSEVVT